MVSRYQNGPVKPEGMCLLPQPYRMMPPRNDILVTPPGYAQTPGNQGGNQGPGIRGIAPSGPPNQASTPPNAELKVQQLQQQPALNHMYMRPAQATYYQPRSNPPPTQTPRMPNHNNRPPQPVYSPPTQYMMPAQTFIMSNPVTYYNPQQRPPSFVPPTLPMYGTGPPIAAYQFNPNPSQSQVPYFYNTSPMIQQRGTSISQSQSTNPNPTQAAVPAGPPIVKPQAPMQRYKVTQNKRRPNAIAIIDPNTGEDKSAELYDGEIPSRPASGESSTCQTPQPNPSHTHKQEVQATFAKMVFQALQEDVVTHAIPEEERIQRHHFVETCPAPAYPAQQQATQPPPEQQQQPPAQQNTQKIENIVQSSKLQALAKEFVLPNTAKEPPVVSANCDAVEVTLPNKLPKDRESPVKRSKPREQQPAPAPAPREHKDSLKESSTKETIVSDKPASIVKEPEVKPKEVSSSNTTNVPQLPPTVKETVKENNHQNQDKRGQRKDVKPETVKAPSIEASEAAPTSPVQPLQPTHDVNCNAKPKPNVLKSNAKLSTPQPQQHQSQAQNSNTKPASIPVPQPQPPKPSNKSHKKNEINQKGANKEGTDMDAFNDNLTPKEEVNANLTSNTVNDIINANTIPLVNNVTAPVKDINVNIESNKTLDSTDLTIKSEPPKTIKPKIDITDIVKEIPKPLKLNIDSHDEIDRASIPNDRLVQAKNEANAKSNDTAADKLPYKDGQWTPNNPSGCKVYQKDFLIALKDAPSSRMRPDNIPDVVLADERGRLPDGRHSMGGRSDMTNPPFNNFGGKSGSQRGGITQRNSKTKMIETKRKGPSMKVSISVREDVKLHESENAWRPARYTKGETATEDDKKTEDLYRKVRGVLNKLTPQKFSTLLTQIKALQIDTASRLQGVIDLVFEKAVDEPNFSVAYASMCAELALMQVPAQNSTPEKPEVVNFRKLLINRCQVEFEKQSHDESVRKSKVKEINECSDQEKKKDLEFELEEYDRRLRMKSVGNIRFIGELFKQNMLTVNIMMKCLKNLLDNKDEESLECLCKLLTTIGKELETKHVDLSQILSAMKSLAEKRDGKVSSRIRFMLKDVIDLKNSKWIPRRQDHNPKTIDQIQKEADQEQLNIQMMHSAPMQSRRDDRVSNMGGSQNTLDRKGGRGNRNNASDSDGWIASNSRNRPSPFTVQSDKLKSKAPLIDEPLGNPQMFGSWGKGSVGSSVKSQPQTGLNTTNMYAALENIEPERRNFGGQRPGSKDPYSSKGPSMERSYNKYDGRGSRSGSQHRSNDSSGSSSQRSTPAPMPQMTRPAPPPVPPQPAAPQQSAAPTVSVVLSEDQMERRIGNSLDEYVSGNCTVDEYYLEISSSMPASFYPRMVSICYMRVLEKSQHTRLKTGGLFGKLVKQEKISVDDYCIGLEDILSQGDDLVIDVPKIWDYIAEILVDLICDEALLLDRLKQSLSTLTRKNASKILGPLFKLVVEKNGAVFLQSIWKKSGVQLADFVDSADINKFTADYKLEFLVGGGAPVEQNLSYSHIEVKLLELFKFNSDLDTVVQWITTNIGDNIKNNNKFVRTLATAIFQDSIDSNCKLANDRLRERNKLFMLYVDNRPEYELQCLHALQALINKMEHPQGLLLSICNMLYELGTISQDCFIAWENCTDPAEQEGKGVAIKQLTSFFTQLKENEYDESDESDLA